MVPKRLADDHIKLMIGEHIKFCQTTMLPVIQKVDQKVEKAHLRIDCVETRQTRLDDPEVGKVSIMWKRENRVILVGVVLALLILANLWVGSSNGGKLDKVALKAAVKEALTEIK
jgi:hypothetical protein